MRCAALRCSHEGWELKYLKYSVRLLADPEIDWGWNLTVQGIWAVLGIGCGGGVLAELARWYSLREAARWPHYATRVRYWVITALMVLSGGCLAVLYGVTEPRSALLIANIGASAPLIIKALAAVTPPGAAGPIPEFAPANPQEGLPPLRAIVDFVAGR